MDVILALDIGSSSVRCTAYQVYDFASVSAITNCSALRTVRLVQPTTGKIEVQLGDTTLMDQVDACVDETLQSLRKLTEPFRVVGVGCSCFVMNLVAVKADGSLVGQEASMSYACNAASVAAECQTIRQELGPQKLDHLYQQTGAPIHSAYALAQLRQFYHSSSTATQNCISKWQTISSVIASRWTATASLPISFSEASWTGLLNVRDCTYETSILELLPGKCRDALPKLADFNDTLFGISKTTKYWDSWPELRDCPIFLGLGDGACANIGSKCSTASRIAVTIGTSAAARVCLRQGIGSSSNFQIPNGLWCYRVDKSHVLVGGALTDGGSLVEWALQLLNLSTEKAFSECLEKVQALVDADHAEPSPHNASSLITIPFLSGERSTGYRDNATGAIMGLTRDTTPAHVLKSCLEGVTLRIRAILKLIVEARGCSDDNDDPIVVVSGKALEQNGLWRQMISDSSGLQVIFDEETHEGTSRGVARLVAVALAVKHEGSTEGTSKYLVEEEIQSFTQCEARPRAQAYFDRAAQSQDQFIDALTPLY
jgi:gluconokinase